MLLTTRLKVGSTVGAHCLRLILIGIVIINSEPVRGHAPPRAMYYGHRVEPREPFKHIPSALVFGDTASARDRQVVYDMPTCSQLKNMWKTSIRSLNTNNNNNFNDNYLESNQIPVLLNNPYYMAFLWQQSVQNSRPHFGKIVSEPIPPTMAPTPKDIPPVHHYIGNGLSQKSSANDGVPPIPGHFSNEPSEVGVVYGHVIKSPSEAEDRHHLREKGVFGDFVAQGDDSTQPNERSSGNSNNLKHSSSVKQQRTGSTNSFTTAEDFFKSGVWHEKPVIPSYSFQRFH